MKMYRYVIAIFFWMAAATGFAQQASSGTAFPMIELTLTDGARYTDRQLQAGPLVLIYFSPDCAHCKQFITALLQREKLVKSRQILLATFVDVNTLKSFEETMELKRFPTIRTGTEGESYRIAKGLGIRKFPYVALYNSSRKLVRSFEGEQPFAEIVQAIEGLQAGK